MCRGECGIWRDRTGQERSADIGGDKGGPLIAEGDVRLQSLDSSLSTSFIVWYLLQLLGAE